MEHVIAKSLQKALDYNEYKSLILNLLKEGKSTGAVQSDALYQYTKLNEKRMKRLDKQVKLSDETADKVQNIEKEFTWLVLTESWCGDAAQTLPIINKIAEKNTNIELKVVLRDDNEDLMNQFLTNGSKSIPKLVVVEKDTKKVVGSWGPRSIEATQMVDTYKEEHGKLDDEFKKDLQVWYNKDKGKSIEKDMSEFLNKMQ